MTTPTPHRVLPTPTTIRIAAHADAEALTRLWNLFRHEMSAYSGALPDRSGRFRDERLRSALTRQPGWQAWIATAGHHPVGLAVARALDQHEHVLSSCFVVGAARHYGLGRRLAEHVLTSHLGRWSIAYQDRNAAAAGFWPGLATALDPQWTSEKRAVPDRPDLAPDTWITLTVRPAS
jgi:predicted acetyltransferase